MTYKLTNDAQQVMRISDSAFIPFDVDNSDYQQYLEWLQAGNQPEPPDPKPELSYSELRRQAYQTESDPLFFKAQRGEATQQDWLDKVAEIKARWPS